MKALKLLLLVTCLCFHVFVSGQTRQPSTAIDQAFVKMFPQAENVDWKDKSDHFTVFFEIAGKKCEAKFGLDGVWQSTQMPVSLDSLPRLLTDSLKVGRYADWSITTAYLFRFAKAPAQYHLVMAKPGQSKKILLYSPEGKLLSAR